MAATSKRAEAAVVVVAAAVAAVAVVAAKAAAMVAYPQFPHKGCVLSFESFYLPSFYCGEGSHPYGTDGGSYSASGCNGRV